MKATKLIKDKGVDYAENIVCNSPENALYWVEGYEFKCGQSANDLSDETKEKYFVSIPEIKELIESHELIASLKTKKSANSEFMKACMRGQTARANMIKKAIEDVEACQ